jgi:outer membrane autotransporter protein
MATDHDGILSDTYIGTSVGVSWSDYDGQGWADEVRNWEKIEDDTQDSTFSGTFKIGKKFNNIRAELEYGYMDEAQYKVIANPEADAQQYYEVNSHRLMVNAAYDFELGNGVKVFPLAGVGWAINRADAWVDAPGAGDLEDKWNSDFAWSLGAGVSYDVTQNIAVDFSYQYLDLGEAKTGAPSWVSSLEYVTGNLETHELKAGIRYSF